jgi:hypothetical protein
MSTASPRAGHATGPKQGSGETLLTAKNAGRQRPPVAAPTTVLFSAIVSLVAVTSATEPLDEDGINPTRALILHAYWGLRRERPSSRLGTRDIAAWIRAHEPDLPLPSDSLILLTLETAGVPRRAPGRPWKQACSPPFCPATEPPRRGPSRT